MATTEDGTAQPPYKRLRRDARARACDEAAPAGAAAERRRSRLIHHSDGLYVRDADSRYLSATEGARDHDDPPEAEAATRARFGLQKRFALPDDPSKRKPANSASVAREESQLQLAKISSNCNPLHRWNPCLLPDSRCQMNEDVERKFQHLASSVHNIGMVLDSVQNDVMQLNRAMKETSLDSDSIKKKFVLVENSLQQILNGQDDLKALFEGSIKSNPDQLSVLNSHTSKLDEISSALPVLTQVQADLRQLKGDIFRILTNEMKRIVIAIRSLSSRPDPMQMLADQSCTTNKKPVMNRTPVAKGSPHFLNMHMHSLSVNARLVGDMEWIVSCDMRGEGEGEGAGACVLGAAMDIFLVQPRDGGVPPPRFQTLRRVGWSYWTGELRFWLAKRLGTSLDIPESWTWESVMGQPAYGGEGCVMKAIATCMRAQHCIAFERRYGAGTFPYQLSDVHMQYLIDACREAGVWEPIKGAEVLLVLKLMKDRDIWVRTQAAEGGQRCLLRFTRFGPLNLKASASPPASVAAFIRLEGPIIGALCAGPDYLRSNYDEEYVYRGNPGKANHAVVCMAHRLTQDGELHIRILDNIMSHGPMRWILFGAFHKFYFIEVEPLDRAALQHQQNNTGVAG